ncbi:ABC transporter substrate-binding protein [Caldinitratiruptor microaerophilus]|nr:ABC transporter substrate-binding protein [Caldinitratiruptor microaerophilus]
MRRREFLRLIGQAGVLAAGGYLFGCAAPRQQAQQGGAPQGGQGAGAAAGGSGPLLSAEITVTHWPSLLYGVPWMVALDKGYFKEERIELKGIVGSDGGGTTVRNVVTGGLPIGEVATAAAYRAWAAGAPLIVVGGGVRSVSEINWVTREDRSDIQTIQDLRGKKIAFTSPGSVTEAVLTLSLKKAGLDPLKDVQMIAAGGVSKGLTALKEGAVDAAADMEPVYSAKPEGLRVVFWARDFVPAFQQTVLIVGPDLVKQGGEAIRALLRARRKGIEYVVAHRDEAAEIFARESKLPVEACRKALETVKPDVYYTAGLDPAGLQAVEEQLRIMGLAPADGKVPWKDFVNQDFLPDGVGKITL